MRISTFTGKSDVIPVEVEVSGLAELAELLPTAPTSIKDVGLWCPAVYVPGSTRAKVNVVEVATLVIDLDHLSIDDAPTILERIDAFGLERWLHSTYSHMTPSKSGAVQMSLRYVVALSRPVTRDEWPRFWKQATHEIAPERDRATCDASRFYYLPSARPELLEHAINEYRGGTALDVDAVLERADGARGRPAASSLDRAPADDAPVINDAVRSWALRRVEVRAQAIRTYPDGSGVYAAVRDAAYELGGLVAAGALALEVARRALCDAHRFRNPDPIRVVEKDEIVEKGLEDGARRPWCPARWYGLTDVEIAEKIAKEHCDGLRFVETWDRWIGWDSRSQKWSLTYGEPRAFEVVAELVASMLSEAEYATEGRSKALRARVVALRSAAGVRSVISVLKHRKEIRIDHELLDADPWKMSMPSGVLDLKTAHVDPHSPDDYMLRRTSVDVDVNARCPSWDRFLLQAMCGDAEMVGFLKRAVGFSLTGVVDPHALFFLYGTGGNGKGVFVRTIKHVLGSYAITASSELLMAKRSGSSPHPTAKADLYRTRLASISEVEEGKGWDEIELKALVDSDAIRARRMHEDFWQFQPTHHFWVSGNYRPSVRGVDNGVWRRLFLIPFENRVEREDRTLEGRLRFEAPGILAWALDGCLEWQERGLDPPATMQKAKQEYQADQDIVGSFVEEMYEPSLDHVLPFAQIYTSWSVWCGQHGYRVESQKYLALRMDRFGQRMKREGRSIFVGLRPRGERPLSFVR